jgi:hypothetical protein
MSNHPQDAEMSDIAFVVLLILFLLAAFFQPKPTPAKHSDQGAKTYKT